MKKKIIFTSIIIAVILLFASCKQTDVIAKYSVTSFKEVLDTAPQSVSIDNEYGGWTISAPDNSTRFIWSRDFSRSFGYDVMIEFDAKPFIKAGLDISKLPKEMHKGDKLIVGTKLGNERPSYSGEATPIASLEQIVNLKRESISYHAALDHFGIDLMKGNAFEWAKDMSKNDKDIVFVLDPVTFINAGVDPAKTEGWVYAKVKTMDMNGKTIEADKFLKSFNIK